MSRSALLVAFAALATPARAADDPVTFRGSLSWLTGYRHTNVTESVVNPDNQVLEVARHEGTSELRPNLKVSAGALALIFRPRVRVVVDEIAKAKNATDKEPAHGHVSDEVGEAYGQWTLSDAVTIAYGRQNYQWGAAESLSPSNRIFHEVVQSRGIFYEPKGHDLARINFSAGKHFSTIVMGEIKENTDLAPFRAEEAYQSTGLVKPEVNWNNGADYLGFVVGAREHERGWVGEYFNLSLPIPDGLSFYGDASHERGSRAWYPRSDDTPTPAGAIPTVSFEQRDIEAKETTTLAVGGLRYDFEGGTTIRTEYVYNSAAWTDDERELALKAFDRTNQTQLPLFETNARRFLAPGFEVPGRRFAFASILAPDAFSIKDLQLYARATRSLTDGSIEAYGSMEFKAGDAGTVLFAYAATDGDPDSELRGYAAPTQILAYRHDW